MHHPWKAIALTSVLGLSSLLLPQAKGDAWNKRTILTVNETVIVPGGSHSVTLEPGKYVMRLADSPANRHIVQVFNEDETKLMTTILAIPNYRLQPTGDTKFTFWEVPAGNPKAMRSWFYPGDNFGQEFVYSKPQATEIAKFTHERVPYQESESLATTKVQTVDQTGTEYELEAKTYQPPQQEVTQQQQQTTEIAQSTPPPAPMPEATPQATPQPMPEQLPQTASPFPLVGLAGLLSLGAAGVSRLLSRLS